MQKKQSGLRGWIRTIADIAVIVLIVLAAKTAIAEPFYVPSGSMEPTLLIGDELLATKFSYGYSTASLPSFLDFPLGGRPHAGLGQARDRPAGRAHRAARRPGLHQRRAGQARRRRRRHGGDRH